MKTIFALFALILPITVMADDSYADGERICTSLKADIVRNYDVSNLELIMNGNPHITSTIVSCTYRATTPEMYGDSVVMLVVTLNPKNNRFTVDVR